MASPIEFLTSIQWLALFSTGLELVWSVEAVVSLWFHRRGWKAADEDLAWMDDHAINGGARVLVRRNRDQDILGFQAQACFLVIGLLYLAIPARVLIDPTPAVIAAAVGVPLLMIWPQTTFMIRTIKAQRARDIVRRGELVNPEDVALTEEEAAAIGGRREGDKK